MEKNLGTRTQFRYVPLYFDPSDLCRIFCKCTCGMDVNKR